MRITAEQYYNHDCHLTAEDSCETCQRWFTQVQLKVEDPRGLREIAYQCWRLGYYTFEDYCNFVTKNNLTLF